MTELTCPHIHTGIQKQIFPDPVGIEEIKVCLDCGEQLAN